MHQPYMKGFGEEIEFALH